MVPENYEWRNPDAAIVMSELRSVRLFLIVVLVIVMVSLALNASRTYLVSTQIKTLQKENIALYKKGCKL